MSDPTNTLTCGLCLLRIIEPGDAHELTAAEARDLPPLPAGMPVHVACLAQERDAMESVTDSLRVLLRAAYRATGATDVPAAAEWSIGRRETDGGPLIVVRQSGEGESEGSEGG